MTKTKLTKREQMYREAYKEIRRKLMDKEEEIDKLNVEHKAGGVFVLLVLLIVFLLGNLLGHWISNQLREPTWHSPKGCPLSAQQEGK